VEDLNRQGAIMFDVFGIDHGNLLPRGKWLPQGIGSCPDLSPHARSQRSVIGVRYF
jgi:hypothetical protein